MKNEKIELKKGRFITRRGLFKVKERFHRDLSRLPFEEKIKILMKMRELVESQRCRTKRRNHGKES